jgi:hypothetical protein
MVGGFCLKAPLTSKKESKVTSIFMATLVLMLPLISLFPGKPDQIKIGLLESQWCATTTDFKDDYSIKSAYSYSIMRDILSKGPFMWIPDYPTLEEALNKIDTLIIFTPIKPFETKYISAIEKFVSEGGTLVAVADHTDLYGHASTFNELLNPFGIRINKVALFKEKSEDELIRVNGLLFKNIKIKTPCTIAAYRPINVWAWASGWISEKADYSKPNFFGELNWTSDDQAGNWPVGATLKHHAGQVIVFCDSTVFANFAIFQPKYIPLLLKILFSNKTLTTLQFYGAIILVICLTLFICYGISRRYLWIISLSLVILSGNYYYETLPDIKNFLANHVKVYVKESLIEEVPPTRMPDEMRFSTAYANIARSGTYPLYSGEFPDSVNEDQYILICEYDDFINKYADIVAENAKIIITSEIPSENIFKFEKHKYIYDINSDLNSALGFSPAERFYYSKHISHTLWYRNIPILSSYGILNDRFVGNWWVNGEISPFRRYIFSNFYEWIKNGRDIEVFNYPPIAINSPQISEGQWYFKTDRGESKKINIKVNYDQKGIVYCGSGFWALHDTDKENEYLLGGTELSDDMVTTSMSRWAGVKRN